MVEELLRTCEKKRREERRADGNKFPQKSKQFPECLTNNLHMHATNNSALSSIPLWITIIFQVV